MNFDEYDTKYRRMAELSARREAIGYHGVTPEEIVERESLTQEIDRLREEARALIPYGSTLGNHTWDGKRA